MTITQPHLVTRIPVWAPRYKKGKDQWEALLAKYKVDDASPVFIIDWTKAKHMQGMRHCMRRSDAQRYPVEKNGLKRSAIDCYVIPLEDFESWQTAAEVRDVAFSIWEPVND